MLLNDGFDQFEGYDETGDDCDGSDHKPHRHLYSTSGTTGARPGHDPLAVTTLHSGKFYLNLRLVHKGQ